MMTGRSGGVSSLIEIGRFVSGDSIVLDHIHLDQRDEPRVEVLDHEVTLACLLGNEPTPSWPTFGAFTRLVLDPVAPGTTTVHEHRKGRGRKHRWHSRDARHCSSCRLTAARQRPDRASATGRDRVGLTYPTPRVLERAASQPSRRPRSAVRGGPPDRDATSEFARPISRWFEAPAAPSMCRWRMPAGVAATVYLALWNRGEEIDSARTDRPGREGAGDPARFSGADQQTSASTRGEEDNGTAPAGVISTCSSSLTPSRPPTAPMKLSTHSTMPSSIIPS
jgi:hypothetical protein